MCRLAKDNLLAFKGRECSLDRKVRHDSLKEKVILRVDMFYHFFIAQASRERQDEVRDDHGADWIHLGFLVTIQRGQSRAH